MTQSLLDGWMGFSYDKLKVQVELEQRRLAELGRAPTLEDEQIFAAAKERLANQRSAR